MSGVDLWRHFHFSIVTSSQSVDSGRVPSNLEGHTPVHKHVPTSPHLPLWLDYPAIQTVHLGRTFNHLHHTHYYMYYFTLYISMFQGMLVCFSNHWIIFSNFIKPVTIKRSSSIVMLHLIANMWNNIKLIPNLKPRFLSVEVLVYKQIFCIWHYKD